MTRARPVYPGRFQLITRRCSERRFFLRPDPETNNAYVYCLGVAAQRYRVDIVLSQLMSNHHHPLIWDPDGKHVEFRRYLHSLLARSQNALRGRWENLWARTQPSVVELVDRAALLNELVYVATNPVKDGLVERVQHWPGPSSCAPC